MAKDVIHTHGKDVEVREDTAKEFRGVNWALASVAAFIVIAAILLIVFFFGAATDGSLETPAQIQNSNTR
jgi:hypothetical protein